jgi:hypothetical protein
MARKKDERSEGKKPKAHLPKIERDPYKLAYHIVRD